VGSKARKLKAGLGAAVGYVHIWEELGEIGGRKVWRGRREKGGEKEGRERKCKEDKVK